MSSALLVPTRFDLASYNLAVSLDGVEETLSFAVTASRDYWLSDDGTADSSAGNGDLVAMLQTVLQSHTNGAGVTCSLNASKNLVIQTPGVDIRIDWDDAADALDPTLFGFVAESTDELDTITSPNRVFGWWLPAAELRDDSRERQVPLRARRQAMTGAVKVTDFGESTKTRDVSWQWLQQSVILTEYETVTNGAFEHWWVEYISKGERTRLYEDASASAYDTYRIGEVGADPMSRNEEFPTRWDVRLSWRASS